MPPRLGLKIDPEAGGGGQLQDLGASFQVGASGTLAFRSLEFRPGGVRRKDETGNWYRVCEDQLKFVSTLGTGASSVVLKALLIEDSESLTPGQEQRFVAVKKINVSAKELRDQMHNDVKVLIDATTNIQAREAPGLINFIGAYHSKKTGQIAIVLEYMSGGSLADVLYKVHKIPEPILARITLTVLTGLFHLHKKMHMVHRDIKPANILLSRSGEPKITDFGITKPMENTEGMCKTFVGTMTYMAPERIESKPYGYASDIWSLGLCLVECATGKYPYDCSKGPVTLMLHVLHEDAPLPPAGQFSPEFIDFCSACLKKKPDERPTAFDLLSHPFILKHRNTPVDMATFMANAIDSHSKLDEIGFFFAHNLYRILTLGLANSEHLLGLAPLYVNDSIFTHQGTRVVGRKAITQCLHENVSMMRTWGICSFDVTTVDCSGLPAGKGVLVSVQGLVRHVDEKTSKFAELFKLHEAPGAAGNYYVANQAFRLMEAASAFAL